MSGKIYVDALPRRIKLARAAWLATYYLAVRWIPSSLGRYWYPIVLRLFRARIGAGCRVASTCLVWAPWNLELGSYVCLAEGVDCYNVAPIRLASYSTVSQRSFLCSASHDIRLLRRPLISAPIAIGEHAWICAESFVGPGVTIGAGAVVGARAVVTQDVADWMIVAGNPARTLKERRLLDA